MARGRIVAQLPLAVACALMAWQVWLLFQVAAAEGARVTWSCDVSSCGTDEPAGGAPMMGAAAVVALSLLSGRTAFVLYDLEHPGDATSSRVSSPRKGRL
ncbi:MULTISPECIES: hypothetical protein [unclassified Streptomyces]|uniref:hypothetical protein n=1 Tax=unclassified Streptomyces TaxID=2593676 RepID=UPI0009404270|nr:hypothetical protein [Streptomyces sp. TSRI0281]OKI46975.1 hypothetical protein A6A29_25925 [Streptomyces sp. TSRI0281]